MTTGIATAQSQRNRSEPWAGGAMQKDHTGMMLTLQFQTDSCVWEHSSALSKGRRGSLRSGKPATLGAEVGLWPPCSPFPCPRYPVGARSCLWCVSGAGARLGGGFAVAKLGVQRFWEMQLPAGLGPRDPLPAPGTTFPEWLWLEWAVTSLCSSDALAVTLGPGAAGMEVADPQLG